MDIKIDQASDEQEEQQQPSQQAAADVKMAEVAEVAAEDQQPAAVIEVPVEEEKKQAASPSADESNKGDSDLSYNEDRLQQALGYIKPIFKTQRLFRASS